MTAKLSPMPSGHAHLRSHRSHSCSSGQRSRSAKVPVTISDSYVSLGWWMVMSDDEQGYAPAVYLEPVEENNTEKDVHPQDNTDEGMVSAVIL